MKYTKEQQSVIDCIDSNLQVIACAGSGKTQVISERIINILLKKPDVQPQNIVAFTYTERAAAELKERIQKLCKEKIGNIKGLAEMYVGTIHGWCLRTLQNNALEYQKFAVLDDIKLKLFCDRNYSEIGMLDLDMDVYKDTGFFIDIMTILRESNIEEGAVIPEKFQTSLQKYEKCLIKHCYFDYTMIQSKLLEAVNKNPDIRKRLASNIKYLVVDEYQDVNPIQEKIVELIFSFGVNICVVGDDDQTIYEWRGSDINNILQFRKKYSRKESPIVYKRLEKNFRSSPAIVDTGRLIAENNTMRLEKKMIAAGHQNYERGDILYNQYTNLDDESEFITETIKELRGIKFKDRPDSIERGLDYADFAILIRRWKNAESIVKRLREEDIPFIVGGINQLFHQVEIQAAKGIFLFLAEQLDEDTLKQMWLEASDELDEKQIEKAIALLKKKKPKAGDYYERFNMQQIFWDFLRDCELNEVKISGEGEGGNTRAEIVFYNLGMFSQVIQDFEIITFLSRPTTKLKRFLDFLRFAAEDYYPEGWLDSAYRKPNAVQIMTVFQAKGLEFPVVFVPWLNKNNFPIKRRSGRTLWHWLDRGIIKNQARYERSYEAERRLLYVAITRAKKFFITSRGAVGKLYSRESDFGSELRRSDYVFESKLRDWGERDRLEPKPLVELGNIDLTFSILKHFFNCPYRFKFYCMYRFYDPLGSRMGYGRAVHNILMEIHRRALDSDIIKNEEIKDLVEKHSSFPYALDLLAVDMKKRVSENINKYLDDNREDFKHIEFAEKDIEIDLGKGIRVSGRMDLIRKKKAGGEVETTIVDFKSSEDAHDYEVSIEQLKLYSLGYEALTGEKADFLEIFNVEENNRYKMELSWDDMDGVKHLIRKAADKIRNNEFNEYCGKKDCVCRFKS